MHTPFVPQAAAFLGLCLLAFPASADAAVYDVDASASSLTVTGNFAGIPAAAQTGESNTFFLDGTLVADAGPTSISFAGGSLLDGLPFGSDLRPGLGGADSSAAADFGLYGGNALVYAEAAGRDFAFDLSGGPATLTGGSFAAGGLTLEVLSGTVDYRVVFGSATPGTRDLTNGSATNSGGLGSLTVADGVETLTIPVTATYTFTQDGVVADVLLEGQIVATRAIPEPTGLAALGGLGLLAARRRR